MINTVKNFQYKFENYEYLMFPEINKSTRETYCQNSIYSKFNNYDSDIYLLGQVFITKYNEYIRIRRDPGQITIEVGLKTGDPLSSGLTNTLVFVFTIIFLTIYILALTWKKWVRKRENEKRWKDIRELEKDYDVYVSDEYAY